MDVSLWPRLVSVHPILVHVTLGVLPVVVLAYAVAAARRSAAWSFAGDVALWVGASVTLATAAFGLVSNAVLDWPGGLGTWRWWHLGLAAGTSALLLGLAAARAIAFRRGGIAGARALAASAAIALLYVATGWIGGEILVYRSGMAVEAAARGALAPPLGVPEGAPEDLHEAMERLRGAWSVATFGAAGMVVDRPDPAAFDRIASSAADLQDLARWLHREGAEAIARERHGEEAEAGRPHAAPAEGGERRTAGDAGDLAAHAREEARALHDHATALEQAARERDLPGVSEALGRLTRTCAHCHEDVRWKAGRGHAH